MLSSCIQVTMAIYVIKISHLVTKVSYLTFTLWLQNLVTSNISSVIRFYQGLYSIQCVKLYFTASDVPEEKSNRKSWWLWMGNDYQWKWKLFYPIHWMSYFSDMKCCSKTNWAQPYQTSLHMKPGTTWVLQSSSCLICFQECYWAGAWENEKDRLYVLILKRLTIARHIVTVPVKDGCFQICGDHNQSLAVEQYPLPRPEDLF